MTHEDMLHIANQLVSAINDPDGFEGAEVIEHEPGKPIPIAFRTKEGQGDDEVTDFVVELNVL